MKITKYPDGTSYVTIPKEWENTFQEITFKINTYEDVIHLAQLCDVLYYNRVEAIITIPNLLDGQADRRFDECQSSGLLTLLTIFKEYVGDDISFHIFHPHNPEVVEAVLESVEIIDNTEFIQQVLLRLGMYLPKPNTKNTHYKDNLILMSSDAGGFKPLMKLCDKINWKGEAFSATKSRQYIGGESKLIQQIDKEDFKGKDILIIDDISVYGGTFKGLSKLLKDRNCGKLYLAVSHMTVQDLGLDPVTNYFDKVFTTNSKYDEYLATVDECDCKAQPKNLEIIKLF